MANTTLLVPKKKRRTLHGIANDVQCTASIGRPAHLQEHGHDHGDDDQSYRNYNEKPVASI
jgi:ribosomal protein S15P/S13E